MFVQSAPVGWRLLKRQGIVLMVCEQDAGAEGDKEGFRWVTRKRGWNAVSAFGES
jgi:hypothetical protein